MIEPDVIFCSVCDQSFNHSRDYRFMPNMYERMERHWRISHDPDRPTAVYDRLAVLEQMMAKLEQYLELSADPIP